MISVTPVSVTTAPTSLVLVPPGPGMVAISAGTASTAGIFVGQSTAVTSSNGIYVPGGAMPFIFAAYQGSAPQQLYAVATSGTVASCVMTSRPG